MSGSSLEGKAFLRSHKTLNSKALLQDILQHKTLLSKAFSSGSSKVTVNFVFLKPTNKDKPAALTSYEHLEVQLCLYIA